MSSDFCAGRFLNDGIGARGFTRARDLRWRKLRADVREVRARPPIPAVSEPVARQTTRLRDGKPPSFELALQPRLALGDRARQIEKRLRRLDFTYEEDQHAGTGVAPARLCKQAAGHGRERRSGRHKPRPPDFLQLELDRTHNVDATVVSPRFFVSVSKVKLNFNVAR